MSEHSKKEKKEKKQKKEKAAPAEAEEAKHSRQVEARALCIHRARSRRAPIDDPSIIRGTLMGPGGSV
jgi:hypothetical protein